MSSAFSLGSYMLDILQKYNKYTFFWSGPFSNWTTAPFVLDDQRYTCVEQYMMHKKALMFGDTEIAEEIMKTSNPREHKAWGRKVRNFDMAKWAAVARDVVFRGCVAKFTQNPEMYNHLLKTKNTLLVEASPLDKVWGIGLDEKTVEHTPMDQWTGSNWLGQIITEVREVIEFAQLNTEANKWFSGVYQEPEGTPPPRGSPQSI